METTATLASIVTSDMISGVFGELLGLLPVVLPAVVMFVGIRKGISFLIGMLHSA